MKLLSAISLCLMCLQPAEPQRHKPSDAYPPQVGEPHPLLALPSASDGQALALSNYDGQRVLLLHFSIATKESRDALISWNEQTRDLIKNHRLAVLAVSHDASPAQARLFFQWKKIDWPLAHDVINHCGVETLPLALYINEKGIIKQIDPEPEKLAKRLAKAKALKPREIPESDREQLVEPKITRRAASEGRSADSLCIHGDALVVAGQPPQIDEAIEVYKKATNEAPEMAKAWFGLGVAHHMRAKLNQSADPSAADDGKAATAAWKKVRELAPDNQVFKIEIEEFKAKPAALKKLFEWVEEAKKEISDRGDKPVEVP